MLSKAIPSSMSSARFFLPTRFERILRDYYAGNIGNADLEQRLLRDVKEDHFRAMLVS
jgi:hypothetical protein